MPNRGMCIAASLVAGLALTSCHRSGTWNDSAANWDKAFQSTKPSDVVVVHSRYWRSAHWSYEFEYYFHIVTNGGLYAQLFDQNDLEKLDAAGRKAAFENFFDSKPAWFVPGGQERYDVWVFREEPGCNFRVFKDRETGDLFLTDYSI